MKTKKINLPLIAIILICVLLVALFAASRTSQPLHMGAKNAAPTVNSANDAANFLSKYGWETPDEPSNVKTVTLPAEFDAVYSKYNELQKRQGFDLSKYRSKSATMYTFRILNHPSGNRVFANVLTHNGVVIAGDLVSFAIDGFLTGLDGG